MEEQPSTNTNPGERSGENQPDGQQDRNRNRSRNRNRGRGRSNQPRGDQNQERTPGDELPDAPMAEPAANTPNTTDPDGGQTDSPRSETPRTESADTAAPRQPGRPERNPDREQSRRENRPTGERESGRSRPDRNPDRDRSGSDRPPREQRQPGGERNDRNSERNPERTRDGQERNRPERDSGRTRPERGGEPGGGRFGRPERTERTAAERERSIYDRDDEFVPERRPERQETYEPMAVERFAGESVFEDDADPAQADTSGGRTGRRPLVAEADQQDRLIIGISLGDYNGVGPEVILKALQYNQLQKICTPVIYGSMRVLNRYRNLLNLKDWNLNGIQQVEQASHKMTNVITCFSDTITVPTDPNRPEGEAPPAPQPAADIQPGKVTPEAGLAAFACLSRAVEDLKAGKLHALVTAPINKHNIQSEAFSFPGHTEYLASAFGVADNLMFMVSEGLKVGVVTGHVPLNRVRQGIHKGAILQKIDLMTKSLKQDFGIRRPKIAVLGLNPHAGERGLLGAEEAEIITPLINDLRQKGQLVYGPFPADGFFGTRAYRKYDAVLAMYHDQGLIPFKAIAFEGGVNFTAGMPAVRTSPDHGTAYDIAGKGQADETSMVQAIYTACDVARRRQEYQELEANALKK